MKKYFTKGLAVTVVFFGLLASIVYASESDGTILPGFSNAKVCHSVGCVSPTPGVINFRTTKGTPVTIADTTGLSGNAWGNELGWIDFKPTGDGPDVGVSIDPDTGIFSGKAWSRASGWINFSPTGQQVSVNEDGEFEGWAWTGGAGGGWIKFDCADAGACVKTDWRPTTVRDPEDPDDGGDGGTDPGFDICPNIPGNQALIPSGYVINARKQCVLPEQCSALDGNLKQPIDIVLVVDNSGSVRGTPLQQSKDAAYALVDELVPGVDRVSYVTYAANAVLASGFNDSYATTKTKITATQASNAGGTNIGGAFKAAQNEIAANGRPGVKHMIIVMGDGLPTTTDVVGVSPLQYARNEANVAKADGTVVYSVGFGTSISSGYLKSFATTPANYYYAATGLDLINIYIQIVSIGCTEASSAIAGTVIYDKNANGNINSGEVGLASTTLSLISTNNSQPTRTVVSGSDGAFIIRSVAGGSYSLCATPPTGMYQTKPTANGCHSITIVQGLSQDGFEFLIAGTVPPAYCVQYPNDPLCVVPPGSTDICLNIPGVQPVIPPNYVINAQKDCVLPEQCSVLDGVLKQPLDVVLAIDTSGSVRGVPLQQSKDAALAFIDELVPGVDRVAYVTYSAQAKLVTGFGSSYNATRAGVQASTASNLGGTNFGGALKAAQNEIATNGRPGVKRMIIILGDGIPTTTDIPGVGASLYAKNEANNAKVNGTTIYTVAFGPNVGTTFLKGIATLPQYYYYSATGEDLADIYVNIASYACTAASSIAVGSVIHDKNTNAVVDVGEPGLANALISLKSTNMSQPTRTMRSGGDGVYSFTNVTPGSYSVCATPLTGMWQTFPTNNGCYMAEVVQGLGVQGLRFLLAGTIPAICLTNPNDPLCIVPPDGVDMCPNIDGDQPEIPYGMQLSQNGNCVDLPDTSAQGSLKIVSFSCSSEPILSRSVNGPSASGAFTVPDGCTTIKGAEFGAVFMPGKTDGGGGYPYSNGEGRFDVLGLTSNDGELIANGLSTEGRYNVAETYGGGYLLPNEYQYGLFCYGGGGSGTDNLDYTFVPEDGVTHCVSYRARDLCPNVSGVQKQVPDGAYIANNGDCVTPTNPSDLCPNIPDNQTSIPFGKILNSDGDCVDVTIVDACPNIDGYQPSVPPNQMYDANGNCISVADFDMCPNIIGKQPGIPLGMILTPTGNCVPTPSDDVGGLKITSFICPTSPALSRAVNGPNAAGTFTAPASCTRLEGSEFGSIFMPGVYTGAGGYPWSNGERLFDVLGMTGQNGELLVSGLSTLGRYNVAETYNGGNHLPNTKQYGLFCYGDNGTWTDNLDYTFVPKNGMTHCVSYRAADLCPNIAGEQHTVPGGTFISETGDCYTPPNPSDICPNILGDQTTMPPGKIFNSSGQCVDVTIPDACPNINGYQASVPSDRMYDANGNCVLVNQVDLCPNLPGAQPTVPQGRVIDVDGNCTQVPMEDMCPNLAGEQYTIPPMMVRDASGACVINPEEPGADICLNIDGAQSEAPSGFIIDGAGNCVPPPWISDVCPNIAGDQSSLPAGMVYDRKGDCVDGDVTIPEIIDDIIKTIGDGVDRFVGATFEKVSVPVRNALTSLGLALPVAAAVVSYLLSNPIALAEIPLLIGRGWSGFLIAIGWRKRKKPWGTVYDSVTKRPIDPAYVVLKDLTGKEIASAITDINGRYGFAVDPGTYVLDVHKTNYQFPSDKLAGKSKDDLYDDLYFGAQVTIEKEGDIITKNIPMDQLAFDWNEYEKAQKSGVLGKRLEFYRRSDITLRKLSNVLFIIGFAFSIYAISVTPSIFNSAIVGLYVFMTILRLMKPAYDKKGAVRAYTTGKPLPFSIVRLVSIATNQEVGHKVADRLGNYYGLAQNGTYNIVVDTKKGEQEYEKHPLPYPVVVSKGYLKETFKV